MLIIERVLYQNKLYEEWTRLIRESLSSTFVKSFLFILEHLEVRVRM